jgi:1,4-dihydroxy-2-naphthoate octaprenyltransferase
MGLAYSVPPLRLNAKPWASQPFWLAMGLLGYFTIGAMAGSYFSVECVVYCLGMAMFMGVGETLAKDIRDWDNDKKAGKHTSVVSLGPARAALYSRWAGLTGSLMLLAFLWTVAPISRLVAALESALVLYWLGRVFALTGQLQERFDKQAGMLLHTGYIRTYLLFNVVLLVGLSDRIQAALRP